MSDVRCRGDVSSFLPVYTGVRQGCVLLASLFKIFMGWVLGTVVEQSHCGTYVGNTEIKSLVFALDSVIFVELSG